MRPADRSAVLKVQQIRLWEKHMQNPSQLSLHTEKGEGKHTDLERGRACDEVFNGLVENDKARNYHSKNHLC